MKKILLIFLPLILSISVIKGDEFNHSHYEFNTLLSLSRKVQYAIDSYENDKGYRPDSTFTLVLNHYLDVYPNTFLGMSAPYVMKDDGVKYRSSKENGRDDLCYLVDLSPSSLCRVESEVYIFTFFESK